MKKIIAAIILVCSPSFATYKPTWSSGGGGGSFYGDATWATASGCSFAWSNSGFGSFSANTNCNDPSVTGSVTAPTTKIPAIKLDSLPAGSYLIIAQGNFQSNNGNEYHAFRLYDGTNSGGEMANVVPASGFSMFGGVLVGTFTYGSSGNRVIEIQARSGGSYNASIDIDSSTYNNGLKISVYKF